MSINPIHKAPYTNFHDLNLDWIIEVLNEFNTKLTNFVSLATIKYADPIQWDITSQYEANTVVVDSNGNAYLSVRPVTMSRPPAPQRRYREWNRRVRPGAARAGSW